MTVLPFALLALAAGAVAALAARRRAARSSLPSLRTVLLRNPAAAEIRRGGRLVLRFPGQAEGLALSPAAERCWALLDGTRTLAAVARVLASERGSPIRAARSEVREIARQLERDLMALARSEAALVHVHHHDVFAGDPGQGIVERRPTEGLIVHAAAGLAADDGSIDPGLGRLRRLRGASEAMARHREREARIEEAAAAFNQGWRQCGDGRLGEAEAAFARCAALAPSWANAHYQAGYVYLRLGRYDEAIRSLSLAEALSPGLFMVREYLDQARRLSAGRLSHEAFLLFDRANAAGLGDVDAAIRLARRALEITPAYPSARLILARAYEKKDLLDQALAELDRALETAPDEATLCHVLFSRGSIFMSRGLREQAVREWEKVIEINGSTAATRSALKNLASSSWIH